MEKTQPQQIELSTVHLSQNIVHDLVIDITELIEERGLLFSKVHGLDREIEKKHRAIYQEIAELGASKN